MEYLRDYRKKNLKKSRIHIKVEQEQMTYTPPLCGGLRVKISRKIDK